jgi:hypothetical protein
MLPAAGKSGVGGISMRVEATVRRAAVARPGTSGGANRGGGGFTVVVNNDAPPPSAAPESAAAGGVGALLALQAVADPLTERRRAVKGGRDLLDALDEIKLALLEGRLPAERIERLAAAVGTCPPTGEAGLDGVLAAIDLRAQVELAKLGRFSK